MIVMFHSVSFVLFRIEMDFFCGNIVVPRTFRIVMGAGRVNFSDALAVDRLHDAMEGSIFQVADMPVV